MRKLLTLLLCFLLASPVPAAPKPLYNPLTVVKVVCELGTGTAFRISDGRYVTAAHVVKAGNCAINGSLTTALVVDSEHDIAVIEGPKGGPTIPISCGGFKVDTDYLSIGYAFGWDNLTVEPLIASPIVNEGYRVFVGEIIPGMSGGPVIGYDGKVRGINNMRWAARSMPLSSTFICKD